MKHKLRDQSQGQELDTVLDDVGNSSYQRSALEEPGKLGPDRFERLLKLVEVGSHRHLAS